MEPDRLVLVVPEKIAKSHPVLKSTATVSFHQCRDLPFVVLSPGQEMRTLFDKLCQQTEVVPDIAAEVVGLTTAWRMVKNGVAATLLPHQYVSGAEDGVQLYALSDSVDLRRPAIIIKRGQYLSEYARFAIQQLTAKNI